MTPPLALPLIRSHPELLQAAISANAPPAERGRLREPRAWIAATTSFLDATAYGVRGMIDDYRCYSGGCRLGEILAALLGHERRPAWAAP